MGSNLHFGANPHSSEDSFEEESYDEDLNSELMSSVDSGVYQKHFGGKYERFGKLMMKSKH